MGWARMLLLGDFGQQLDLEDTRAELDRLRRSTSAEALKDRGQDDRIAALADENEQLKLCLITLARLLVSKRVVGATDVTEILNVLEPRGSTGGGSAEPSNDDLIALADAARRFGGTQ